MLAPKSGDKAGILQLDSKRLSGYLIFLYVRTMRGYDYLSLSVTPWTAMGLSIRFILRTTKKTGVFKNCSLSLHMYSSNKVETKEGITWFTLGISWNLNRKTSEDIGRHLTDPSCISATKRCILCSNFTRSRISMRRFWAASVCSNAVVCLWDAMKMSQKFLAKTHLTHSNRQENTFNSASLGLGR